MTSWSRLDKRTCSNGTRFWSALSLGRRTNSCNRYLCAKQPCRSVNEVAAVRASLQQELNAKDRHAAHLQQVSQAQSAAAEVRLKRLEGMLAEKERFAVRLQT